MRERVLLFDMPAAVADDHRQLAFEIEAGRHFRPNGGTLHLRLVHERVRRPPNSVQGSEWLQTPQPLAPIDYGLDHCLRGTRASAASANSGAEMPCGGRCCLLHYSEFCAHMVELADTLL